MQIGHIDDLDMSKNLDYVTVGMYFPFKGREIDCMYLKLSTNRNKREAA
jgi:hypothetical protein